MSHNFISSAIRSFFLIMGFVFSSLGLSESDLSSFDTGSLYRMNQKELQRVPPYVLLNEIELLERRDLNESRDLINIKSFNLAMCKRLQKLKTECIAQLYISSDHGLDGLACTEANDDLEEVKANITVSLKLKDSKGQSYVLRANNLYESNIFTEPANEVLIKFSHLQDKIVRPPKFKDLTSLQLIAVKKGQKPIIRENIDPRKKEQMNANIKINPNDYIDFTLKVNGRDLLSGIHLLAPDDTSVDNYYRISPEKIVGLGKTPECRVSLEEIRQLQTQSKIH